MASALRQPVSILYMTQGLDHILSCSIAFIQEASDDASASVLGIERITELLSGVVVLLPERERLECERVPFVKERVDECRD